MTLVARRLIVSDLDRSTRFYGGVLGFVPDCADAICDDPWPEDLVEANAPRAWQRDLVNHHGIRLFLTQLDRRIPVEPSTRRPMFQHGLTHLNAYVRDFEMVLASVERSGGRVLGETLTRTTDPDIAMVHCTDPDGIRVEVWTSSPYDTGGMSRARPGGDRSFSHSGICVPGLDHAKPFYEVLGFRPAEVFDYRNCNGLLDAMNETEDARFVAQMLRQYDDAIELLAFDHPRALPAARDGPALGFSSLIFRVDDIERIRWRLTEAGGHCPWGRTMADDGARRIRCFDPAGSRIELVEPPR